MSKSLYEAFKAQFQAALDCGPFYVFVYVDLPGCNDRRYIVRVEVEKVEDFGFHADGKFYLFEHQIQTWRFDSIRDDTALYLLLQKTKGLFERCVSRYSQLERESLSLAQLEEACDLIKQLNNL